MALSAGLSAGVAAETSVLNSFDGDGYIFAGTSTVFAAEVTIGRKLPAPDTPHFNFGVVEFNDLSAFDLTGEKYLRFEVVLFRDDVLVDGFPVFSTKTEGSATLKVVAMDVSFSSFAAAPDKLAWFDDNIEALPAVGVGQIDGLGTFDIQVTDAVNAWLDGSDTNLGFGFVVTQGDAIEVVSREAGNGMVLTDSPLVAAVPGDTDGDGDIDDADLGTSFANYTGPAVGGGKTAAQGDTDGDGDVDDADLGTSFAGYTGPLSPARSTLPGPVPEPSSLLLLGAAAGLVIRRRRSMA